MIEIMAADIAKYDMVKILQQVEQGEEVVLSHNGKTFHISQAQEQDNQARELAFDEFFAKMKGRLPKDYRFDRDEANER